MTTIGARIRAARERAGLSQEELARRVGVSRPTIGTWERDEAEPRKAVAKRLLTALALPASALNRFGSGGVAVAPAAQLTTITGVEWTDIPAMARGEPLTGATTVQLEVTPINPLTDNEYRLVVVDDSMAPDINIDDIISFQAGAIASDGDLVIAHANNEACGILRYYRDRGGNTYDLWPANPEYPTLTRNASTHIVIVGVVVRHLRVLHRRTV